jgi:HNH endonuclease
MGRLRKVGKVHPKSGVTIYNDGTCDAPVSYDRAGYKIYSGSKGRKRGYYSLHRHVAELFIPNPEKKPVVNHKDGRKYNSRASNLEWSTHSENSIHAHASGLNKRKLVAKDVVAIRKSTLPAYRICFKFDISAAHVKNIRNRTSWKHIL